MNTTMPMTTIPWQDFTPEQQLLLWAVRVDATHDADLRALLAKGIDWTRIPSLARDHGLLPLLHTRLKSLPDAAVPAETQETLSALYRANAVRNFRLLRDLLQVLTLLKQRGVNAIPVKGLSLALQAYGDVALRYFVDLDLVLPNPADFYLVYQTLREAGFHTEPEIAARAVARLQRLVSNHHFTRGECNLEIHWTMPEREYGFVLDGATLWSRVEEMPLQGCTLCSLAREDAFLLHLLHGTKHQWNRLIWIADLAYLCKEPGIDWTYLFAQAARLRVLRILHTTLLLVARVSGVIYPDDVRERIDADPHAAELVAYLYRVIFADEATATATFPQFIYRSREHWRDKLHYLAYPRIGDQEVIDLPKALFPLYYLIRPIRVLRRLRRSSTTP